MEEVAVERIGRYVIWLKCRGASDYSSCRLENDDILTTLPKLRSLLAVREIIQLAHDNLKTHLTSPYPPLHGLKQYI